MAGKRTILGAQVQVDPARAIEQILTASAETRGVVRDMAAVLNVTECTLHRIITKLGIRDRVHAAGIPAAALLERSA